MTTKIDREICESAAPGEWELNIPQNGKHPRVINRFGDGICAQGWTLERRHATFIAHFDPTKVRSMLDELDRLNEILDVMYNTDDFHTGILRKIWELSEFAQKSFEESFEQAGKTADELQKCHIRYRDLLRKIIGHEPVDHKGLMIDMQKNIDVLAKRLACIHSLVPKIYNNGYMAGHHDTVESRFVDLHPDDMGSYHDEESRDVLNGERPELCNWKCDEIFGNWETDCGNTWLSNTDELRFCPYCGRGVDICVSEEEGVSK